MKILMQNSLGQAKECKVGFSWTMLFFGFFVPLFRGDFLWALLSFILSLVTVGVCWIVLPFIYNKIYIKGLIKKGYRPTTRQAKDLLVSKGIL